MRTMRTGASTPSPRRRNGRPASMSDAARLRSLGYRASETQSAIRPTVASVVARRGLPRPRSGMPPSWVDESYDPYEEPEPSPLENVARFLRGVATVLERIARTGGYRIGVVLAVTQAQGVTIQLPNFLGSGVADEHPTPAAASSSTGPATPRCGTALPPAR